MMESDYDLPSLHCYTMNPASNPLVTSHPSTGPLQQQQQQQQQQPVPSTAPPPPPPPTPLKRTRAKRSCDFCRQRKSRCDADTCTPCTNCKAWGYTCEFQTVRKKRGPPSVYVDNLEKRCKKMEQLLMQLTNTTIKDLEQNDFRTTHRRAISDPSIVSDSSSDDDQDDTFSTSTMTTTTTTTTTTPPTTTMDNSNSIVRRLEQLDIHDYDSIKYTGQSAGLELLMTMDQDVIFKSKPYLAWPGRQDTVLQRMPDDQFMVVRTETSPSTGKIDTRLDVGISITSAPLPSSSSSDRSMIIVNNNPTINKPPKSLITQMVTLYFTHLHPILPIINQSHFLRLYETRSSVLPKILLQAMLALSFRRFGSTITTALQQQQHHAYADYYFQKVMKRLLQETTQSRLCYVQAGLLVTVYLEDHHHADTSSMQWQVLGKAIRMAQDLGLHRSCAHWHHLPRSEIETRHRVFYACYILDRWIGARAGKPLTILDRDFDTALPSMYEEEETEESPQPPPVYRGFYLWIKLSEILGRVLKALYAPSARRANVNAHLEDPMILHVFDRRLQHWYGLLQQDDDMVWPGAQKVSLEIYYHTVILLLRRPFLGGTSNANNNASALVTQSRQISLQSAWTIFQLTQQQQQQQQQSTASSSKDDTAMTTMNHHHDMGACHILPTCYVYALFLSSLVHVAVVLQDRTSVKKRRALGASLALLQSHPSMGGSGGNGSVASLQAFDILNMIVSIHDLQPLTDGMPLQLDDHHRAPLGHINTHPMIHNNNSNYATAAMLQQEHEDVDDDDSDGFLDAYDPVPTTSKLLGFHPPQPTATTSFSLMTSSDPMSKPHHWFQRFVNTSVIGGGAGDMPPPPPLLPPQHHQQPLPPHHHHHGIATIPIPPPYFCPPHSSSTATPPPSSSSSATTTESIAAPHLTDPSPMFYTPYMPSPPMPSSSSSSSVSPTIDLHPSSYSHPPTTILSSPEEPSSGSSHIPHHHHHPTTTSSSMPPSAAPMPYADHHNHHHHHHVNWHDWPFYMPPSSSK